jgi:hypothetical protein
MVGTMIAQRGQTLQPTGKELVVIQSKLMCDIVFQLRLAEVIEEL